MANEKNHATWGGITDNHISVKWNQIFTKVGTIMEGVQGYTKNKWKQQA